jgi:hypothetical protein
MPSDHLLTTDGRYLIGTQLLILSIKSAMEFQFALKCFKNSPVACTSLWSSQLEFLLSYQTSQVKFVTFPPPKQIFIFLGLSPRVASFPIIIQAGDL